MRQSLNKFFTDKYFRIPSYQRDFEWETTPHIDDLINDIIDSIETETNHYIGTFILSKTKEEHVFHIVDGQQRLTALTMLINIAIQNFGKGNNAIIYSNLFIKSDDKKIWKLELQNDNSEYLHNLLESRRGPKLKPKARSQKLLKAAYEYINRRLNDLKSDNGLSQNLLSKIEQLEVIEFIEEDDGKAIRIFQAVNDRGRPLSNMDKAKSLLVYYSNRFLNGELDTVINGKFGNIFQYFSEAKDIAESNGIDLVKEKRFTEDSLMRYHYLSYEKDNYYFKATEDYVFRDYLKIELKRLQTDKKGLKNFLESYVDDLENYYEAFLNILRRVPKKPEYYNIFNLLGLSTYLYPLLIRLELRDLLHQKCPIRNKLTFLKLIEITDVRVYKIRGSTAQKEISILAKDARECTEEQVEISIVELIDKFANDEIIKRLLEAKIYPNSALKYIYFEFDQKLFGKKYALRQLKEMNKTEPTIEHIFPEEASFEIPSTDFKDKDEYDEIIHTLGNLTILEEKINKQCQNKIPRVKISSGFYERSQFRDPQNISNHSKNNKKPFEKDDVKKRTDELMGFIVQRWGIK